MAPGRDGSLYISIPGRRGDLVALLGETGEPLGGWPILLEGARACDQLFPVADGSVRVVCADGPTDDGQNGSIGRAFAFDDDGRSLPGWPVDIDDAFTGRVVGDVLALLVYPVIEEGSQAGVLDPVNLVNIASDGTLRKGVDVLFACCDNAWAVGPDGIAYATTHRDWSSATSIKTDILAFGLNGARPDWPVTIDGNASELAFDARGRIYMVVGSPNERPARTVVLDPDGRVLASGSGDQPITSTSTWDGAGADYPGVPIVGADGTSFIVSTEGGTTTVAGLDPDGQPLPGWPYRSTLGMEWIGFCNEGDTGCGQERTVSGVGSRNELYLFHAASSSSTGGIMVAIEPNGRVRSGWPVGLRRAGSMFWSIAVGPDGRVWALAVEPETRGYSATILAIAHDSTVVYATTVVEP